jgi:hypothetical protein
MAPPQPAYDRAFDPTGRAAFDPRCRHGTEKHQIAEAHSHSSSAFLILLRNRITLLIRVLHMPIYEPNQHPPLQSFPLQRCSGRSETPVTIEYLSWAQDNRATNVSAALRHVSF